MDQKAPKPYGSGLPERLAGEIWLKSGGKDSTALGARSNASSASGTALGHYANTTVDNGVALGSKSQASREAGVQGYVPEGTELTDEQKKVQHGSQQWQKLLLVQKATQGK